MYDSSVAGGGTVPYSCRNHRVGTGRPTCSIGRAPTADVSTVVGVSVERVSAECTAFAGGMGGQYRVVGSEMAWILGPRTWIAWPRALRPLRYASAGTL